MYEDISSFFIEFLGSSFVHVYCVGNSLAYKLARYILNFRCDVTLFGEISFQLRDLFTSHCNFLFFNKIVTIYETKKRYLARNNNGDDFFCKIMVHQVLFENNLTVI